MTDDPDEVVGSVCEAIAAGASPEQLGRALAFAAALRIVRFHPQNDFGDIRITAPALTYNDRMTVHVGEIEVRLVHPGGECYGASLVISDKLPAPRFEVVTRDLFADFGEFTLTGLAFSPVDGNAALFDHLYLGRQMEDFELLKVENK